jgi:hypothetical protein
MSTVTDTCIVERMINFAHYYSLLEDAIS